MFSDHTLSVATDSSPTWLHNASRLLAHPLERTHEDARWWRLVHIIHADVGLPLRAAAKIADSVLRPGLNSGRIRLNATADGAVAIQLDVDRFLSTTSAAISSAINFSVPPRRGRPPIRPLGAPISTESISGQAITAEGRLRAFRANHAEVRVLGSLSNVPRIGYRTMPRNLEHLSTTLAQLGAKPRDIPATWPFTCDTLLLRAVPQLALHTAEGDLDLLPLPEV